MDEFLANTIVVTPERLLVHLINADVGGSGVVEIQPWFKGAPADWLEHFDRFPKVRDRYQIATDQGIIEVTIKSEVKAVLSAIKAMPGRRAAGATAERFVHNPFGVLGPDSASVIDESQFEQARYEAGIEFKQFHARVAMQGGDLTSVGLSIEALANDQVRGSQELFEGPSELRSFIARAESKLDAGFDGFEWRGHRLQFIADSRREVQILKGAYKAWVAPRVEIRAADVLNLSRYSARISGIGTQPRIVSPYIPRASGDDPWFPLDSKGGGAVLISVPLPDGRLFEVAMDQRVRETLREAVARAKQKGAETIDVPGCPGTVPVPTAERIIRSFDDVGSDFTAKAKSGASARADIDDMERRELVLRANIATPDFEQVRAQELKLASAKPRLPSSLKRDVSLKDHQQEGVAWLQNLWDRAPAQCHGALLADDMGLGKTLQLLCLVIRALEENPSLEPVLVVAPVTLLENWNEELEKFFAPKPRVLTLYGKALQSLRAPRELIDEDLLRQGLSRFLKTNWLADSRIVLTTYETLRDLEFSLAATRWSLMICDEAQRIKNPAAMVTRAAKKQNATFRIACTGTPVENSLTDLWSLFDFVQPGLLGALNDFGASYRRPIECETDEQRELLAQLRRRIEPQVLRRNKADVARDLPAKISVPGARQLQMSDYQRTLYSQAIEAYKLRRDPTRDGRFGTALELIQYLRRLCIAPGSDLRSTSIEPLSTYREKNPKMGWLIDALHGIQMRGEKVILFCEFRDTQLLLAHYVSQEFGFRPDIVNGSVTASASAADSRQKRINRFQEQSGFSVIILSPIAIGFGVNIQAANHVVHFSRSWNPAKEDQATDRVYRIDQTRTVYVYCPMVRCSTFTTFDEKLDLLLEGKRALSHDMLNGFGDLEPGDFLDLVDVDESVFDEPIMSSEIAQLNPLEFEALVAVLWKKLGFRYVALTPKSGDGGVDVLARTSNKGELIQCKTSSSEGARLGWEAIKDVVAGEARYRFENPGVTFFKVAITNQYFGEAAKHQASLNNVRLIDQDEIALLLKKHRVVRGDIEKVMSARHARVISADLMIV